MSWLKTADPLKRSKELVTELMQQIIAQTCIATGIFGLKLQKYGGGLAPPPLPPGITGMSRPIFRLFPQVNTTYTIFSVELLATLWLNGTLSSVGFMDVIIGLL